MSKTSLIQKTRIQALSILLPQAFPDSKDLTAISAKLDQVENFKPKLDEDEENFEEQDFTFSCANPQGLLIYADEMFYNGHIQPIFPNSNQSGLFVNTQKKETSSLCPPLKKRFIAQRNCNSSNLDYKLEEPYCKWQEK
ncbi:hypothetical protein RIF29_33068 [Crotalaria pallida]|uniref:Uncharacterized protein n=1 Tax=Crotalaria pallida TaxID=3830 RepID=A0AAN9E7C5_CROPI